MFQQNEEIIFFSININIMFYLLDYNFEDEKKDISLQGTIYNKKQEIVDTIFNKGIFLNEKDINPPFTVIIDEKESRIKNKRLRDKISISVINSGFLFLVSPSTKMLFEKLQIDNLQFFDVSIKSRILKIDDYKIINITDKINCADFKKSDLRLFEDGDIKGINQLVLDEKKIPKGKQIFLLGNTPRGIILVHKNLKEAIEKSSLTGFTFINLDQADEIY